MLEHRKTKKRKEQGNKRVEYKLNANGEWEAGQESMKPLAKEFKPRPQGSRDFKKRI